MVDEKSRLRSKPQSDGRTDGASLRYGLLSTVELLPQPSSVRIIHSERAMNTHSYGETATPRQGSRKILGWIGLGCVVLWWLPFVLPKRIAKPLATGFEVIGPFQWILLVAMVVLPVMAAKRGSKWWLSVSAAGVITFVVIFLSMH